jgi:hypothetical protein
MRRVCTVIGCLIAASGAFAQDVRERLQGGFQQLDAGAVDEAMTTFRDVQTDDPESDLVQYSIARAQYEQALRDGDSPQDALEPLHAARAAFDTLTTSEDPFVRENALYNSANCSALIAKHSAAEGNHEETVKGFEDSIRGYEEVLEKHPNRVEARGNLNHMRYLLKKMLQNPPPPEEQQEQQEGEEGEEENQEQSEGEEQEQQSEQDGEPSEEESDGESSPDEEGEESEQDQGKQDESEQEQGDADPSEQEQEGDSEPQEGEEGEEGEGKEPLSRQNIEAILNSLEEEDREEQKNLRRSKTPPRMKGNKWW